MPTNREKFLLNAIRTDELMTTVIQISAFHRVKGMGGLLDSIEMLRECLLNLPGTSVTIRDYPSDGATRYGTWSAPMHWRLNDCHAELNVDSGERIPLVDRLSSHFGVFSYSGPVMPRQLFHVIHSSQADGKSGSGNSRNTPDPPNTVVFFRDFNMQTAAKHLLEKGYRGIITAPSSDQYSDDSIMMHARHWHRIPQTGHEDFSAPDRLPFGFSISPAQGDAVESLLHRADTDPSNVPSPTVSVSLDTAFAPGRMPVLEVVVDGGVTRDNYVVITSHICHPGPSANDNASGVATAAALAGVVAQSLADDPDDRYKSGAVFLFVPENLGTLAWLLDPPIPLGHIRAGLNFDMTGADPDLSGARLYTVAPPFIYNSALAGRTFQNLQRGAELLREIPEEHPSTIPMAEFGFSIGSDNHILNFPDFGIPSVGFGCWPDRFYHTDADTPERINPATMKHVALAGALTLLELLESAGMQNSGSPQPRRPEVADSSGNAMASSTEFAPRRLYRGPVYRGIVFDSSNGRDVSVLDRLSSAHRFRDITAPAPAELLTQLARYGLVSF